MRALQTVHLVVVTYAFAMVACGKGSPENGSATGATETPSATASVAPPAPSSSTVAVVPSSVPSEEVEDQPPTERRAERKAASEITHENYKAELTKLEKELRAP